MDSAQKPKKNKKRSALSQQAVHHLGILLWPWHELNCQHQWCDLRECIAKVRMNPTDTWSLFPAKFIQATPWTSAAFTSLSTKRFRLKWGWCWIILGILRILFTSDKFCPKSCAYSIIYAYQLSMIYTLHVNHPTKTYQKCGLWVQSVSKYSFSTSLAVCSSLQASFSTARQQFLHCMNISEPDRCMKLWPWSFPARLAASRVISPKNPL